MELERSSNSESDLDKTSPAQDIPEEWFKRACHLASSGKQEEAELALKTCLNIQEEYPIAWAMMSAVLLSQGRETDAEKAGKKAITQCPTLKMSWPKMRSIIRNHGIIRGKSWKDPQRVVFESMQTSEWGTLLVKLGEASHQDLDVIETVQEDSSIEEEDSPSEEIKNEPESFEIEIEDEPEETENSEMLFAAAESLLKRGYLKKAEEAFRHGLEIDPDKGEAWLSLSSLRMGRHKYDDAVEALRHATQTVPSNSAAWYQLGYCYQKLNKWEKALQPLRNAVKIDQSNPDYWMALGYSQFHLGKFDGAARSLLRAIRISPNHRDALFYLALTMERKGNTKHALSLYLKLLNLELSQSQLTHQKYQRLASAFDRLKRPREARQARRKAELVRMADIQ